MTEESIHPTDLVIERPITSYYYHSLHFRLMALFLISLKSTAKLSISKNACYRNTFSIPSFIIVSPHVLIRLNHQNARTLLWFILPNYFLRRRLQRQDWPGRILQTCGRRKLPSREALRTLSYQRMDRPRQSPAEDRRRRSLAEDRGLWSCTLRPHYFL